MLFRSKSIIQGPNLPVGIRFPCTLNVNEELIFMIGMDESALMSNNDGANFITILSNQTLAAYIFNQSNESWTYLGHDFPCQFDQTIHTRFTCAYLRHEQSIVAGIDFCTAILNLSTFTWTSHIRMRYKNGVLFNIDQNQESVVYIGSNNINGSHVSMVNIPSFWYCVLKF